MKLQSTITILASSIAILLGGCATADSEMPPTQEGSYDREMPPVHQDAYGVNECGDQRAQGEALSYCAIQAANATRTTGIPVDSVNPRAGEISSDYHTRMNNSHWCHVSYNVYCTFRVHQALGPAQGGTEGEDQ